MYRELRMVNATSKRREDVVLAEAAGEATHWMPIQEHQRVNYRVVPAQRATQTVAASGFGRTFDDYPNPSTINSTITIPYIEQLDLAVNGIDADIEVQYKSAGQLDAAAQTIERHTFVGTPGEFLDLTSVTGRRGFIRVIATRLVTPVALSLEVIKADHTS